MKIPRAISCDWAVPFEGCGGSFFFQLALFLSYLLFFSLPFLPSAIFSLQFLCTHSLVSAPSSTSTFSRAMNRTGTHRQVALGAEVF